MPIQTHGDIESRIMLALNTLFTSELITNVPTGDPLKLRRLIAAPLQDDPTTTAPYLVYGPAYEIGRSLADEGIVEIGGNLLWQTPFRAVCGTPRQATRDNAYQYINELAHRVEASVLNHFDLAEVLAPGPLYSDDKGAFIDAQDPSRMWLNTRTRIYGGDQEFYGEALMYWRYNYYRITHYVL